MAQGDTPITLVGNIVADPELRFTPSGAAVANFRVASTPRRFNSQTNQWEDGEALFLTCNVWRQAAENVAESLQKGMRVIVTGRLRQRSYETREGEKRTTFELDVDEIGPSLRYATAQVTKTSGGGGGGFGGGQRREAPAQQQRPAVDEPWGGGGQQRQQPQQEYGSSGGGGWAAPGTQQGGYADEPPF